MNSLFDDSLQLDSGALFSDCRKYRYRLWRIWNKNKPLVMFIGLNPSTANEVKKDPTIGRVMQFAKDWGYGGFYMMNLYSLVSPYPKDLLNCADPINGNDFHLWSVAGICDEIVFAWGSFSVAQSRAKDICEMFPFAKCLSLNKNGSPKHPLYIKSSTTLIPFVYA